MWLCLNKAFLSIVDKDCGRDELLVRARVRGHIEAVFPDAVVSHTPGNDYLFRAAVKRAEVVAAFAEIVMSYRTPNFKNSVKDHDLHDAYSRVWGVMAGLQETPPYSRFRDDYPIARRRAAPKKKQGPLPF